MLASLLVVSQKTSEEGKDGGMIEPGEEPTPALNLDVCDN